MAETPDHHFNRAEVSSRHRGPIKFNAAARICWHASQIRYLLQRGIHDLQALVVEVGEQTDVLIALAVEIHLNLHAATPGPRGVPAQGCGEGPVNEPSRADEPELPPDSA